MRFVSVRDLRSRPREVWSLIEGDDVVITSNGHPLGVIVRVEGGDLDETLASIRRARAQAALSRMRERAEREGTRTLSEDEIQAEIQAARQTRFRR